MPKRSTTSRRPEPRYASGEVRLTHNNLALLHGLLDRPGGVAPSIADWIASAMPYVARFRHSASISLLRKASRSVHADWVQRKRVSRSITVTLTPRGREIVERKAPVRIIGAGPYTGLPRGSADHTIPGLRSYPPPLRPSNLPSLDVPGFDLDFRPSSYPREFTEIARMTFGDRAPDLVCFCARRVGRSFRLSAESFPIAWARTRRRVAPAIPTFGDLIELIDGVGTERHRPIWPTNDTYLDRCVAQWRQGASSAHLAIEQLGALRVESAIYPGLQAYYAERVRRWVELLQREMTPSGASYVTDRR